MVGNQAMATVIGLVPVLGDVGIAMFKTNFRNAALLEEYLRIRGAEFLKVQADRVEDPAVVEPGAGQEEAEEIPGKLPPKKSYSFFRRSSKKVSAVEEVPSQGKDGSDGKNKTKPGNSSQSRGGDKAKGKGKEPSH